MLATSRFWRLTVWGWSLYDSWLTSFWRIWVKWYFIKRAVVAFFFLLIGVRFAFGHWATQAGEPADRTTAGAQHHPHGDYTEVLHCTNNHAVMHECTSLTHIQSSILACTLHFLLGLATLYIFAILLNMCMIKYFSVIMYNLRVWNKKLPSCLSTEQLSWLCLLFAHCCTVSDSMKLKTGWLEET